MSQLWRLSALYERESFVVGVSVAFFANKDRVSRSHIERVFIAAGQIEWITPSRGASSSNDEIGLPDGY
ncbi:hypothetical protein V1283_001954 [Bradyrhizobium sp. AZCC 2262]